MMANRPSTSSESISLGKKRIQVLDAEIAYIDAGSSGSEIPVTVFLHGVPTSSYLWRNIIPYAATKSRCIAPDLIGFGDSDKISGAYHFADHQRYIDAFLDAVVPNQMITLVIHDWGSALGFHWACRNEHRVAGIAFMEFIHPVADWSNLPSIMAYNWRKFRDPDPRVGRELLIEQNMFIEEILPGGVVRKMTSEEMEVYRGPFLRPEWREPLFRMPNELPVEGQPEHTWKIATDYMAWLLDSEVPKLFFWAKPGGLIWEEKANELAGKLKNTRSVCVGDGIHYIQEDHPHVIGRELADWLPSSPNTTKSTIAQVAR
ncbi:putative hydrolase [Trichoderma sp. SZMC 28014]